MKPLCRLTLAGLAILALATLALWLTIPRWLPPLLAHVLPDNSRLTFTRPRLSRHGLDLARLSYRLSDCELINARQIQLNWQTDWRVNIKALTINSDCASQLPAPPQNSAPFALNALQSKLPRASVHIARLTLLPLPAYAGAVHVRLSPQIQRLDYQSDALSLSASLQNQRLTLNALRLHTASPSPLTLTAKGQLTLANNALPQAGKLQARLTLPESWLPGAPIAAALSATPLSATPAPADSPPDASTSALPGDPLTRPSQPDKTLTNTPSASPPGTIALHARLNWQDQQGQLLISLPDLAPPLLDLPWQISPRRLQIYDGRWQWPGSPGASGKLAITLDNWRQGLEHTHISARLNILTQGPAGKANAVLTLGPGKLSLTDSHLPLRLTGQARHQALQLYASLPAQLRGALNNPTLHFLPGALLWSRGQLIDGLNIKDVRWPLAGVTLSSQGVNGRLQAILHGRDTVSGDFTLHLDGHAQHFLPDSGLWQWRYWGNGDFLPTQSRWRTSGNGEWRASTLTLQKLTTDFDHFTYHGLHTGASRLALQQPVSWSRDPANPHISGALTLHTATTALSNGAHLPPSALHFHINGSDPNHFTFRGHWQAGHIGPARVNGRWDGTRLRARAWWPRQSITVFAPLLPPALNATLRAGQFHGQIDFSAAPGQGLAAAGHLAINHASLWIAQTQIDQIDVILPFSLRQNRWQLGPRQPVSLRIGQINTAFPLQHISADLQGSYPWRDDQPLILSDVHLNALSGNLSLQQLRLPFTTPALLRVHNIETSQITSALGIKSLALSGRINGAFPLIPDQDHWRIQHGWISNPGALTLRMNDQLIDGMIASNGAAASAINWLRYLEINPQSWLALNLDTQGDLHMSARLRGTGDISGKRASVHLNYQHQDNLFTLWRNLSFGDNLENWLTRRLSRPGDLTDHPQRQTP